VNENEEKGRHLLEAFYTRPCVFGEYLQDNAPLPNLIIIPCIDDVSAGWENVTLQCHGVLMLRGKKRADVSK